jgi:hypothetical protein
MSDIGEFYHDFLLCANHKNYLGRLMVSASVYSLVEPENYIQKVFLIFRLNQFLI